MRCRQWLGSPALMRHGRSETDTGFPLHVTPLLGGCNGWRGKMAKCCCTSLASLPGRIASSLRPRLATVLVRMAARAVRVAVFKLLCGRLTHVTYGDREVQIHACERMIAVNHHGVITNLDDGNH